MLSDCKYNCHRKCEEYALKECPGNVVAQSPGFFLATGESGKCYCLIHHTIHCLNASDSDSDRGTGSSTDDVSVGTMSLIDQDINDEADEHDLEGGLRHQPITSTPSSAEADTSLSERWGDGLGH